jgi:hypothetical protein
MTYWTFEDTLSQIDLGDLFLFALGFPSMRTIVTALTLILVGFWAAFVLYPLPPVDPDHQLEVSGDGARRALQPEARGVRRPRGGRPRPQSRTVLALRRLRGRNHDERLQLQEGLLADALHVHQFLDLILENDRANVYAAEVEVRPPCAPTGRVVSAGFLVSWRSEPIISRSASPP